VEVDNWHLYIRILYTKETKETKNFVMRPNANPFFAHNAQFCDVPVQWRSRLRQGCGGRSVEMAGAFSFAYKAAAD